MDAAKIGDYTLWVQIGSLVLIVLGLVYIFHHTVFLNSQPSQTQSA